MFKLETSQSLADSIERQCDRLRDSLSKLLNRNDDRATAICGEPFLPSQVHHDVLQFGQAISADAVRRSTLFHSREAAIQSLPKGGRIAEIGTQTGSFAERIWADCQPSELSLFDLTFAGLSQSASKLIASQSSIKCYEGDSSKLLEGFDDEYFDWIYVDGDHRYEGVLKDATIAANKIKADGILVFNDYTPWSPLEAMPYGILRVVNDMLATDEWEVLYMALHPWGYHDIAIRRRKA